MPKMRPAAIEGVLAPPPSPLIFQASGGPSFGHSWSRPRSLEIASRSGPCHCGQSSAAAVAQPDATTAAKAARALFRARLDRLAFMSETLRPATECTV